MLGVCMNCKIYLDVLVVEWFHIARPHVNGPHGKQDID